MSHFINKLEQKNQTEQQIEQAKNAITLFYKLIEYYKSNSSQSIVQSKVSAEKPKYDLTAAPDISKNRSWKNEFEVLNNEIKLRQYSRKTLRAYTTWVKSFQTYLKSKSPGLLESAGAKRFITHLAVKKQVSASTQNQAFNLDNS